MDSLKLNENSWKYAFQDFEGGLAKRLLGADLTLAPKECFGQITPLKENTKESFGQIIALYPNLIDSSEVPSHEDSESGLNSKITFGTKASFSQTTADLLAVQLAKCV